MRFLANPRTRHADLDPAAQFLSTLVSTRFLSRLSQALMDQQTPHQSNWNRILHASDGLECAKDMGIVPPTLDTVLLLAVCRKIEDIEIWRRTVYDLEFVWVSSALKRDRGRDEDSTLELN